MSKIKMRCITCGKWFQSANAKEVTCPDCMQKARKEKLASKNAPPTNKLTGTIGQNTGNIAPSRPIAPPPKPKPATGGTSHWFDSLSDVKVGQPDQPTRPKPPSSPAPRENRSSPTAHRGPGSTSAGPGSHGEERGPGAYREGGNRGVRDTENRGPGAHHSGASMGHSGTIGQRPPRPTAEGGVSRGPRAERPPRPGGPGGPAGYKPRPKAKTPHPAAPPKPKKEKTPPPPPFVPTAEQIAQVEMRYLELATPTEFDGIRTQISKELSVPKKTVKDIIKDLRARQGIPSWWEVQTYKGSAEELETIKTAYEPLLPLPSIGVHKQIATQLSLKPGVVYQAIKTIRSEMNLPQYNDPSLHGIELRPKKKNEQLVTSEESEPSLVTETVSVQEATVTVPAQEVVVAVSEASSNLAVGDKTQE